MEWLKKIIDGIEGITDEQKTEIVKGFNTEFPKNAVPKDQYKKKTTELEAVNAKLNESTIKIDELSKSSATSDEYKEKLEALKTEHDAFKADTEKREIDSAKLASVKKMLGKHFAEDAVDLIASTYNLDDINLTEKGEVVDSESKLEAQKLARPSLVVTTVSDPTTPKGGKAPNATDYSKLSDEDYYAAKRSEKGD